MGKRWKILAGSALAVLVAAALFFTLEYHPEAAKLDPVAVLKDGLKAFNELSVTGRQRISIFRNGKLVDSEEIKSPVEPLLMARAMDPGDDKDRRRLAIFEHLKELSMDLKLGEDFSANHDLNITGVSNIAGRRAWEMVIKPNSLDGGYIKLCFDAENGYPLKRTKYDRNGKKENVIEFTKIEGFEERGQLPFGQMFGQNRPGRRLNGGQQPGMQPGMKPPGMQLPGKQQPGPGGPPFGHPPFGPSMEKPQPGGPGPFGPEGPGGFQPPHPGGPRPFVPPADFIKEFVANGRVLFPTYLPKGYRFIGGLKAPVLPGMELGRVHMIFTDGVNNLSIFQIHLPPGSIHSGEAREFLRRKADEFLNSYPEGVALRKVQDGLIIGMGDIEPAVIESVLESMVFFEGDQPKGLDENRPMDSEGLFQG